MRIEGITIPVKVQVLHDDTKPGDKEALVARVEQEIRLVVSHANLDRGLCTVGFALPRGSR